MNTKERKTVLLPQTARKLELMGENIRLARLRRKIPVKLVAERAGISRSSVWAVEKGDPSVSIGIYIQVLTAIGMPDEILKVASDDPLGRILQDDSLIKKYSRKKD